MKPSKKPAVMQSQPGGLVSIKQKLGRHLGQMYSGPMMIWLTLFFITPIVIIIIYSFRKEGLYGGTVNEFSINAYLYLGNRDLLNIVLRTLIISVISTAITIFIALPCGYYMAKSKNQSIFLLLIIIPFWTNFLIRVFAWRRILSADGYLNVFLNFIGLNNVEILNSNTAVVLVLVYMYLPYAILPLFASIDKFDFSLLEAARDLGATKLSSIVKVLLPNIKGGLFTAVLFTFIPIFGNFPVPKLVGKDPMLGQIIANEVLNYGNWPNAASISLVLTVITTAGVLLMMSVQRKGPTRKTAVAGDSDISGEIRA